MEAQLTQLMLADLVDYTRTMETEQARALEMIRELRGTYLEPIAHRYAGEVLKRMGDGWIFSFPDADAAVSCSLEVQQGLADHEAIRVRISCHSGEIVQDDVDFYGTGVNLAQRILTEAPPGGVMIAQDVYRGLPQSISAGFRDAGSFRLKGISQPVTLFQWRPGEMGSGRVDEVPGIAVEAFGFAPDDSGTRGAAEDLHEQLIAHLSRRTGIRVLDDSTGSIRDAVYTLRGRLRIAGPRGRLSLMLLLNADSRTIWSRNYEGDPSDVFAFCDRLVEQADVDLRVQINAFDGDRVAHLPADRLSLSELRSRAASAFYKVTMVGWEEALYLMQRAERLSPDDPMTVAMIGEATVQYRCARHEEFSADWADEFERRLDQAVEISPRSDYVFWVRGLFRLRVRGDWQRAEGDIRRVMTLTPAYAPAFEVLGELNLAAGRPDDAVPALEQAVNLSQNDPLLPYRLYLLAVGLICAGRQAEAVSILEQALVLKPGLDAFKRLREVAQQDIGQGVLPQSFATGTRRPAIAAPRLMLAEPYQWLNDVLKPELEN